jgi:hypothetical protein
MTTQIPKLSWGSLFRTARAAATVVLAVAAILLIAPQTDDMLARIAEYFQNPLPAVAFHASLFLMAFSAWHWSRAVLSARFNADNRAERAIAAQARPEIDLKALDLLPPFLFLVAAGTGLLAAGRSADWKDAVVILIWAPLFFYYLTHRAGIASSSKAWFSIPPKVKWLACLREALEDVLKHAPFGPIFAGIFLGLALLVFVVSGVGTFLPNLVAWGYGPLLLGVAFPGPSAVLLALALSIGPLTLVTRLADRIRFEHLFLGIVWRLRRPPIISALIVFGVVTTTVVNLHGVRVAETPVALPQDNYPELSAIFYKWVAKCAPGTGPVRPVIVAVSGGASRAGLWAARVLREVDDAIPANGHTAIFAISSVSGGSVGAAGYTSEIAGEDVAGVNRNCRLEAAGRKDRDLAVQQAIGADALGPLLAGALFGDVPRALFGLPAVGLQRLNNKLSHANIVLRGGDRAEALERAFEWNWHAAFAGKTGFAAPMQLSAPYNLLFYTQGRARNDVPLWIANGTDQEDGSRILTAPFRVDEKTFLAARDAHVLLTADVPASTAIDNTSRFPFLSPAGELTDEAKPTKHAAQIIDGGYFENEGLQTALELANYLRTLTVEIPGSSRAVEPIIVEATADADYIAGKKEALIVRCTGPFRDDPARSKPAARPLQFLVPFLGLINVRGGHSQVALRQARDAYCGPGDPASQSFFHFYLYKPSNGKGVPLNWVLSQGMVDYIWNRVMTRTPNEPESQRMRQALAAAH